MSTSVGTKSQKLISASEREPGAMTPGHSAMNGIWMPASYKLHLANGHCAPLSEVYRNSVFFDRCLSARAPRFTKLPVGERDVGKVLCALVSRFRRIHERRRQLDTPRIITRVRTPVDMWAVGADTRHNGATALHGRTLGQPSLHGRGVKVGIQRAAVDLARNRRPVTEVGGWLKMALSEVKGLVAAGLKKRRQGGNSGREAGVIRQRAIARGQQSAHEN